MPGVTAPNDGDQVLGVVPITISKTRYVSVRWSGEEERSVNNGGPGTNNILKNQFAQAMRTLVNEVETGLVGVGYKGASRATGTPGTTPFATSGDLTDVASALQVLDDNGAPTSDRQLVLGSAAMGNLRGKQSLLFKVNEAGTDQLLRDGIIGRLESFDIHNSNGVKPVTKGTGASYVLGTGSYPVGDTSLALATGTGTVNPGDILDLAGDGNHYVVGTGVAAPGTAVLNNPGLLAAHAAADTVTVGNSYVPNLAFSKSAIVLATRAPALPIIGGREMDMAEDRTTLVDPVSGIAFEISMYLQYRQVRYEVALSWGYAAVKSNHIAILRG